MKLFRSTGFTAVTIVCLALVLSACTAQQQHTAQQAAQPAQQAAQPAHAAYSSGDFIGNWTCQVTHGGRYLVTATSTMQANGTAVGYGTRYGHRTPTYENSWSYAPSGPTAGTMSANNIAFAPPHYTETSAVTWMGPNRYTMVALTDTNAQGIGTKADCTRK